MGMLGRKTVFSAILALAMMTLPPSALAGHDQDSDDHPRANAWHDHGWHKGWDKHHENRDDDQGEDEHHHHWNHREADEDDSQRVCDDCRMVPNRGPTYSCDEDGDDCHLVNQRYWGGYDYGPPVPYYESMPPSAYNLAQQRDWLIQRRQQAYYVLAKMRARHDRNAANRMLKVVDGLNARIARDNQLMSRGGYGAPVGPPYPNDAYGTGYYPNYGTDPAVNAIGGIVGPLIGLPPQP
jgi:hypothetical protein